MIKKFAPALLVDFASTLDDNLYPAEPSDEATMGDRVLLYDTEGAACYGVVERIDDDFVWCRPDARTWFTADPPQPSDGPVIAKLATVTIAAGLGALKSSAGRGVVRINGGVAVYAEKRQSKQVLEPA